MNYPVILFYKYVEIADTGIFAASQRALCESLDLKGRILIASEGINGTLAGAPEGRLTSRPFGRSPVVRRAAAQRILVFHLDGQVRFQTGECREEMIENLLRSRAKFSAPRAHLYPALLVPVIAFRPGFGADQDDVAVVGEFQNQTHTLATVALHQIPDSVAN